MITHTHTQTHSNPAPADARLLTPHQRFARIQFPLQARPLGKPVDQNPPLIRPRPLRAPKHRRPGRSNRELSNTAAGVVQHRRVRGVVQDRALHQEQVNLQQPGISTARPNQARRKEDRKTLGLPLDFASIGAKKQTV
ncbi:unnamed protein product [Diplocarpon coronariae]|nr:hypothetical protein JHW43_004222 [Diplocarpon mali]